MANDIATQLVDKTLGQYELKELVGEGGMATVYKAYQRSLDRWVAVKVLHSIDRTLLARFEREAKAAAQLEHPNILVVHEYGEHRRWHYIAMQLVEGGTTLEKYLSGEPLDWRVVVSLAILIAQALHHAHERGLIHRDVKPSNILMSRPNWPLLADFGLVKVRNPKEIITDSNVVIGTPAYISPEQANAETIDRRADLYSLGIVMFEMVTGRLPFRYKNLTEMINAHLSEPAPSPRQFNPQCPPELEAIILKAIQKSPDDRYANLRILADNLQKISKGVTKPIDGVEPVEPHIDSVHPKINNDDARPETTLRQKAEILLNDQHIPIDVSKSDKAEFIIGRAHTEARVEIDLNPYGGLDAGVSRQHARLIRQGPTWLIEDLDSMNGTYVNKKRIKPGTPVPLKNGDLVRCSKLSFIFLISFQA